MSNRLRAYAVRIGLTDNTSKSEVTHLKGRSCFYLPTFMCGNAALPQKDQFMCLGTLVDNHMNLKVSEEYAVQPYMAAQQRKKKYVHEHCHARGRARAFCVRRPAVELHLCNINVMRMTAWLLLRLPFLKHYNAFTTVDAKN
eukprot:1156476-Pelagomonas_calceolata.AAC.2